MEQYRRVEKQKVEDQIKDNEIRVTTQGKMRSFISYATTLLKEKGFSEIVLKAMGRAINKTVTIAEIIKRRIPDLHQITEIDSTDITDVWEPLQEGLDRLEMTRHVSSIQIRLSTQELDTTSPGYQPPLPKDQVKPVDEETTAALEIEVGEKPRRRGRGGRGRGGRGRGDHTEGQDSPQEEQGSSAAPPRRHNNNNNNMNTNNVAEESGTEGRGRGGRRRRGRGRGGRGGNTEGGVREQYNDEHVESGEQTRGGRRGGRGGRGGRGRGGRGGRADEGTRAPMDHSDVDGQGPSFRRGRRGGRGGGRGGRGGRGRGDSGSPLQH